MNIREIIERIFFFLNDSDNAVLRIHFDGYFHVFDLRLHFNEMPRMNTYLMKLSGKIKEMKVKGECLTYGYVLKQVFFSHNGINIMLTCVFSSSSCLLLTKLPNCSYPTYSSCSPRPLLQITRGAFSMPSSHVFIIYLFSSFFAPSSFLSSEPL